MEIVTSRGCP